MKKLLVVIVFGLFLIGANYARAEGSSVLVSTNSTGTKTYTVSLHSQFDPELDKLLSDVFNKAKFGDLILIDIRSPGGRVDVLAHLIEAMESTKGTVMCNANQWVASAAATFAWNCPTLTSNSRTVLLFHKAAVDPINLAMGPRLTANELRRIAADLDETDHLVLSLFLAGAMTPEELRSFEEGNNIVVDGKVAVSRHLSRGK